MGTMKENRLTHVSLSVSQLVFVAPIVSPLPWSSWHGSSCVFGCWYSCFSCPCCYYAFFSTLFAGASQQYALVVVFALFVDPPLAYFLPAFAFNKSHFTSELLSMVVLLRPVLLLLMCVLTVACEVYVFNVFRVSLNPSPYLLL